MIDAIAMARYWPTRALAKIHRVHDFVLDAFEGTPAAFRPLRDDDGDGYLDGVIRELTPYRYHAGRRSSLIEDAEGVVFHWTGTPYREGGDRKRFEEWLRGKRRESSTHFVILRNGKIMQAMPLRDRAWHVTSEHRAPNGRANINRWTIAIDFASIGHLHLKGGVLHNAYNKRHVGPVAYAPNGKPYEPPTKAQIEAAERICRFLGDRFPRLRADAERCIFGHHDAQPTRPDPGPLWPMDRMRKAIMGES